MRKRGKKKRTGVWCGKKRGVILRKRGKGETSCPLNDKKTSAGTLYWGVKVSCKGALPKKSGFVICDPLGKKKKRLLPGGQKKKGKDGEKRGRG